MSALKFLEEFLRTLAFLSQLFTFVWLHILEYAIRPIYYPFLGRALTKFLGKCPNEYLTVSFAKTYLEVVNITVVPLGVEQLKDKSNEPYLVMYTHGSNLDPMALQAALPFKVHFISKKSLFHIPLVGQALHTMGAIPIDRGNLEHAKESLAKAADYIVKNKKSISIAPEGTRRRKNSDIEPRIAPFKKGPFHLAKAGNVNILPVIIYGGYRIWPPGKPFIGSGIVYVKCLPFYPKEKIEKLSVDELLDDVKKQFDKGYAETPKDLVYTQKEKKCFWFLLFLIWGISWVCLSYKFVRFFI